MNTLLRIIKKGGWNMSLGWGTNLVGNILVMDMNDSTSSSGLTINNSLDLNKPMDLGNKPMDLEKYNVMKDFILK